MITITVKVENQDEAQKIVDFLEEAAEEELNDIPFDVHVDVEED